MHWRARAIASGRSRGRGRARDAGHRFRRDARRSVRAVRRVGEGGVAARAADAPPIGIHSITFGALIDPRLWSAVRLADVGANLERLQIVDGRSAVIALVGDDFLDRLDASSVTAATAS